MKILKNLCCLLSGVIIGCVIMVGLNNYSYKVNKSFLKNNIQEYEFLYQNGEKIKIKGVLTDNRYKNTFRFITEEGKEIHISNINIKKIEKLK